MRSFSKILAALRGDQTLIQYTYIHKMVGGMAISLRSKFPQRNLAETFPYEIVAILAKILVSENIFNTVVYGALPMHIIMHNL